MPRRLLSLSCVCTALGAVLALSVTSLGAQRAKLPRTAAGKPDLSGIWQAMTTANYDIEPHDAKPAMAMRAGPLQGA